MGWASCQAGLCLWVYEIVGVKASVGADKSAMGAVNRPLQVSGLWVQASEEGDAVTCWVGEDAEPAGVGDLGFGLEYLAAERCCSGKGGVDVIGRDIDEHFTGFVAGTHCFAHLDEATARTGVCLEHVVVEARIDLDLPVKEVCVELAGRCGIVGGNFDMDDGMV